MIVFKNKRLFDSETDKEIPQNEDLTKYLNRYVEFDDVTLKDVRDTLLYYSDFVSKLDTEYIPILENLDFKNGNKQDLFITRTIYIGEYDEQEDIHMFKETVLLISTEDLVEIDLLEFGDSKLFCTDMCCILVDDDLKSTSQDFITLFDFIFGFCVLLSTEEDYEDISDPTLLKMLISDAVKTQDFETAAKLKKILDKL